MSILLHYFKQLTECIEQVKHIEQAIIRIKDEGRFVIPQQPQMNQLKHEEE